MSFEKIFNPVTPPPLWTIKENVEFKNSDLQDIVELKNIVQVYDDGTCIIDGLNMLIEDKPGQGQFVVILGPSGCGKSTLLRYIAGLQEPTSGEVLIKGEPRNKDHKVGMVFQQYSSFPWMTVLDNVALGLQFQNISKKERYERAMEMIKLVELDGHEHKYAKHPILSGGQRQRVAIARSLVSSPEILLMDEPFGALDIDVRLKMQDLLCKIWTELQLTVIFVTHDPQEAVYLGDEIYIMRSFPAKIVRRLRSSLPLKRDRDTKRTTGFTMMVQDLEDQFMQVTSELARERTETQ